MLEVAGRGVGSLPRLPSVGGPSSSLALLNKQPGFSLSPVLDHQDRSYYIASQRIPGAPGWPQQPPGRRGAAAGIGWARAAALPIPDTGQVPLAAPAGQGGQSGALWLQCWHRACAGSCAPVHWPPGGARSPVRPRPPRNLYSGRGRLRAGGSAAAMRVAGWAGPGAVHVGPAADPGPAGSSGRCGGWGAAMAAGPGSRLSPRYRPGGAPPCPRHPRALPSPPRSPYYAFPRLFWGQRREGRRSRPRGAHRSLSPVRGARGEAAPSGPRGAAGTDGAVCLVPGNQAIEIFGYLRGR